jgi:hypothetical protein
MEPTKSSETSKKSLTEEYSKYFSNEDFMEGWQDYWEWRKKRKMPVSDRVAKSLIKKIDSFSNGNVEKAIKIVDQALENGWQTFWPLKENVFSASDSFKNRKSI